MKHEPVLSRRRFLHTDTEHSFPDHSGRPMPILTDGEPIRELI